MNEKTEVGWSVGRSVGRVPWVRRRRAVRRAVRPTTRRAVDFRRLPTLPIGIREQKIVFGYATKHDEEQTETRLSGPAQLEAAATSATSRR